MRADSKSEKILEIVFTILLCLSLVCFAGIPALEQGAAEEPTKTIE